MTGKEKTLFAAWQMLAVWVPVVLLVAARIACPESDSVLGDGGMLIALWTFLRMAAAMCAGGWFWAVTGKKELAAEAVNGTTRLYRAGVQAGIISLGAFLVGTGSRQFCALMFFMPVYEIHRSNKGVKRRTQKSH